MSECTWAPVRGWEEYYLVSDTGLVKRKARRYAKERLLAGGVDSYGYRQLVLCNKRHPMRRATAKIHILVLEAFVGPRPVGMLGLHRDGVKSNNSATNLYWGTAQDNALDAKKHGHTAKGARNGRAKLTLEEANAIRAEYATGLVSMPELAARHKVGTSTVCRVVKGSAWTE